MNVPQEEDSRLIRAASLELDHYLMSNVLFWRISGQSLPLTPGNLLLAMKKSYCNKTKSYQESCDGINRLIARHRILWQRKLHQEATARLKQWETTIQDFKDEGFIPAVYPVQVRTRVILELILEEFEFPDLGLESRLQKLDEDLRCFIQSGGFVWDNNLKSEFPFEKFWYLYTDQKGAGK